MSLPAGRGAVLLFYSLLASIYLLYLPHAEFVLDDWYMLQKFDQARAHGPDSERQLAVDLVRNQIWGVSRLQWLSFLSVYGLYLLAGPHPWFYFLLGLAVHTGTSFLLYLAFERLTADRFLAALAGALFLLLPTSHNPLFWFPNCSQYLLGAFWFASYLYLLGDPAPGWRGAWRQTGVLLLALFSTDQIFALLLLAAPCVSLLYRRRAAIRPALLAAVVVPVSAFLYFRFVNTARLGGSFHAKFQLTPGQLFSNLRDLSVDHLRFLGLRDPYYQPFAPGLAALLALAAGGLAVWWFRRLAAPSPGGIRAVVLGAGLWLAAYGPVLLLRWREFRYDYLPSVGLSLVLAGLTVTLLRGRSHALPAAAGLLVAISAATAGAEIRQCWTPMSRHFQAIKSELRRLPAVAYHDYVVVAGTPLHLGTAPHFAMFNSYTSTPFVETVTGVWGLHVARDLLYDYGRLGIEHTDFFHQIPFEDLRRTHLIACAPDLTCAPRALLARPLGASRFELYALKAYQGPALESGRVYSESQMRALRGQVYIARVVP